MIIRYRNVAAVKALLIGGVAILGPQSQSRTVFLHLASGPLIWFLCSGDF
jgi:hypothetical protein